MLERLQLTSPRIWRTSALMTLVIISAGANMGLSCSSEESECLQAKKHMCEKLPDMYCSTLYMTNARDKVTAACGAEEAGRFVPWAEDACSAKTMNCDSLPDPTPAGSATDGGVASDGCPGSKSFSYSGSCTADGRSSTLTLTITGSTVTGHLHADGVCGTNIQLQRTDVDFTGTLSGSWESSSGSISASWTGGDYACDGNLMSGYPTSGSLTIVINGSQVELQRQISGAQKYTFSTTGQVYQPADC